MLNKTIVMGRFVETPVLRYTTNQVPCVSYTLAVERDGRADPDGHRDADFIDCVAWRSRAEFVFKHFKKGQMAAVSGRMQTRIWQDGDGKNRKTVELVTENIYFCGKKEAEVPGGAFAEMDDGELPF